MKNHYYNLLSPLKINDSVVLKNRMLSSSSVLHFLQGPEQYPTDAMITHLANRAKSGAAMVTCRGVSPRVGKKRVSAGKDIPRMFDFDLYDPKCQNYISHLADAIHFYGSKACMNLGCRQFDGYDVSGGLPLRGPNVEDILNSNAETSKELTQAMLDEIIDSFVEQAVLLKSLGFDACTLHMAYRFQTPGRFLSAITNRRTDQYGGGIENRAKFPLEICRKIKKACGQNFVVEALVSAEEDGGNTLEDIITFAKLAEGYIDILQLRAGEVDISHPTGFELQAEPFVHYAEALKDSGTSVLIETIGGYQDLDKMEQVIATGKADLIGMARSWISNTNFGSFAYEGRPEDVTPCIRCNKCHVVNLDGPWNSICSVNPVVGLEHKIDQMIVPPSGHKKIAIVGGGPAGMKAAIISADRGYDVTLFEQSDALGGLLKHSDYADFKWPLRNFKDYLIRQVNKRSVISVHLNTKATPELLKQGNYDAVLVGVGSSPLLPPIQGLAQSGAIPAVDVYGREKQLGQRVVIIGGGEIGMETAIYLAQYGHDVTVIEMRDVLAVDASPLHYRSMFQDAWEKLPNITTITNATCTCVAPDEIVYVDNEGAEHRQKAESIVLAAGMRANTDEALTFYGTGGKFFMMGDCSHVGSLQTTLRSAFSIASII